MENQGHPRTQKNRRKLAIYIASELKSISIFNRYPHFSFVLNPKSSFDYKILSDGYRVSISNSEDISLFTVPKTDNSLTNALNYISFFCQQRSIEENFIPSKRLQKKIGQEIFELNLPKTLSDLPAYILLMSHFEGYLSCQVIYHEKGTSQCPNKIYSRDGALSETSIPVSSFNSIFNLIYKSKNKLFDQTQILKEELGVVGTFLGKSISFSGHKMIIVVSRNDFLRSTPDELTVFEKEIDLLSPYIHLLLNKELYEQKAILLTNIHDAFTKSSELPLSESEVYHHQRISLLGDLLNTLQHELSNPLFGIKLICDLTDTQNIEEELKQLIEEIGTNAVRCQKIIKNFSLLYTLEQSERIINLRQVIDEAVLLTKSETKSILKSVVFKNFKDENRILILTNPTWLGQIIFNLLINSAQAIKSTNDPTHAKKIDIEIVQHGDCITFSIQDTGPGIVPDIQNRIFTPFFTTKPNGTGLGLSICHNLAEKLGGRIQLISSFPGKTEFIFTLSKCDLNENTSY